VSYGRGGFTTTKPFLYKGGVSYGWGGFTTTKPFLYKGGVSYGRGGQFPSYKALSAEVARQFPSFGGVSAGRGGSTTTKSLKKEGCCIPATALFFIYFCKLSLKKKSKVLRFQTKKGFF
jgi:hypothetical protein